MSDPGTLSAASPAFPEVSPLGPDSLHQSPQGMEVPKTEQTVMISEMTAPLDARARSGSGDVASSCSSLGDGVDEPPFTASDPADKWVALSQLAEGVKAAQVREQCSAFGQVLQVYVPRRRAHPVFGVTAFVRFAEEAVALAVVAAFKDAGFHVDFPAAPPPPKPARTRNRGHRSRRNSYASGATSDTQSRPSITIDEIRRRGEERRRNHQQQPQGASGLPPQHPQ